MSNRVWNHRRLSSRLMQAIRMVERDPSAIVYLQVPNGTKKVVVIGWTDTRAQVWQQAWQASS